MFKLLSAVFVSLGQTEQVSLHQCRIMHLIDRAANRRHDIGTVRLEFFIFRQFVERHVLEYFKLLLIFRMLREKATKNDFRVTRIVFIEIKKLLKHLMMEIALILVENHMKIKRSFYTPNVRKAQKINEQ